MQESGCSSLSQKFRALSSECSYCTYNQHDLKLHSSVKHVNKVFENQEDSEPPRDELNACELGTEIENGHHKVLNFKFRN